MNRESSSRKEYDGERDMEKFWAAARLAKEPAKQRWFLPLLIVLVAISIPWYRTGGEIGRVIGGLPGWVWTSLLCTVAVSTLIAVGTLFFWRDDDEDH
jgi:hypothetical protein